MATKTETKANSAATKDLEIVLEQENMSERFTSMVLSEYGKDVGKPKITEHQKQLIQNYFIGIDRMLKDSEIRRVEKNKKTTKDEWKNKLPYIWKNVNIQELAIDVVCYSRVGLDLLEDNHLFPIPFKNNHTDKYDITMVPGYIGMEFIAKKYALDPPKDVITELVYSTDSFTAIKKDRDNATEQYTYEITNPFDRGEIIGAFGYIVYDDETKNKLILLSKKDLEKRKPDKASDNFWGKWDDEMYLKTLRRAVYNKRNIPLDPDKIDENISRIIAKEAVAAERQAQAEIEVYANGFEVDIDESTGEVTTPILPASSESDVISLNDENVPTDNTAIDEDPLP